MSREMREKYCKGITSEKFIKTGKPQNPRHDKDKDIKEIEKMLDRNLKQIKKAIDQKASDRDFMDIDEYLIPV